MYYAISDLFLRVLIYLDVELNDIYWNFKQDILHAPIDNSGSGSRSVINMSKYNRCNTLVRLSSTFGETCIPAKPLTELVYLEEFSSEMYSQTVSAVYSYSSAQSHQGCLLILSMI